MCCPAIVPAQARTRDDRRDVNSSSSGIDESMRGSAACPAREGQEATPPGIIRTREPVPHRRLFVVEVHVFASRVGAPIPDGSDTFPWDALRFRADVVQRVVRQAGRVDLEHGLASPTQEVNTPGSERPADDYEESKAVGQSRHSVRPPTRIMSPIVSSNTPKTLAETDFDESVTRQLLRTCRAKTDAGRSRSSRRLSQDANGAEGAVVTMRWSIESRCLDQCLRTCA